MRETEKRFDYNRDITYHKYVDSHGCSDPEMDQWVKWFPEGHESTAI